MDVGFESTRGYHCSTWNERRVVSLQRGRESSSGHLPLGEILLADLAYQLSSCQQKLSSAQDHAEDQPSGNPIQQDQ
jgi:hypothetical protein